MTTGILVAAILAALLLLWWLADDRRGIEWTKRFCKLLHTVSQRSAMVGSAM